MDYEKDPDDLEFIQFQSLVFNKVLIHYERLASSPGTFSQDHVYFAAEALLKAKDAYDIWKTTQPIYRKNNVVELVIRLGTATAKAWLRSRAG